MKIIAKVFIGCIAFIMILGQLVDLGESKEDKMLKRVESSVQWDLEKIAEKTLNYRSTYKHKMFVMYPSTEVGVKATAYLTYTGANAFGVRTEMTVRCDVWYDLETGMYKIANIK